MVFVQCNPECSALCFRYTSVLDRHIVRRFQKHKLPAVSVALVWLTLLVSTPPLGHELLVQEAEWLLEVRRSMNDTYKFLHFFMYFLSNHGRSGNLFVGSAISITHFAQVCAQRAWRGISVLDHPFGSENWRYVHSAILNVLLDNIPDRLLIFLYDVMNLSNPGRTLGQSSRLTHETTIKNIKVSEAPISLSLGPLNRNIFICCTKMRIDDMMGSLKSVEATATEDQKESFESQLLRWRNTKMEVTAPVGSTMVRSPFIFGVACLKSCSTDVFISGAFWGTIAPR